MKEYSIVCAAYNESDKISSTLTQLITFMNSFSQNYEIIIVDDGSTDDTAAIVNEYSKKNSQIKLIRNSHQGKGVGILVGIEAAEGELIYMADADLSAPISEIKKLSIWIKDHDYDIVIASREGIGANRVNEPFYRHIMGRIFNFVVQTLVLPGINDSQCGFKLFKGQVAKDVFGRLKVYNRDSNILKGPYMGAFDVEVLYIARKKGYKIKEIPVTWVYVKTIRLSPFKDSLRMVRDVFKVKINDFKGMY